MKKAFQYFLIIVLFSAWGILLTNKEAFRESFSQVKRKYIEKPCSAPLEYSLGNIDSRFGISRDDFLAIAKDSEQIWERASGKNLFSYNPEAVFKVNLVFDERQSGTIEAEELEQKLENLGNITEVNEKQYASLRSSYEKEVAQYEKMVAQYNEDIKDYEKEVKYWNDRGGAPKDEYEKLQKERDDLDADYAKIKKEKKSLDAALAQINSLIKKNNQIINNYNQNLETYKNKYGEGREFEKGVYDGTGINIYQFEEKADLELTLVHEFGHSLGIGHLENPQSIMYYMLGEQDLENPSLTEEDLAALQDVCGLD